MVFEEASVQLDRVLSLEKVDCASRRVVYSHSGSDHGEQPVTIQKIFSQIAACAVHGLPLIRTLWVGYDEACDGSEHKMHILVGGGLLRDSSNSLERLLVCSYQDEVAQLLQSVLSQPPSIKTTHNYVQTQYLKQMYII